MPEPLINHKRSVDVLIAGDGTAVDHAFSALVEKCGHRAVVVAPDTLNQFSPRVVIFSNDTQLRRVSAGLTGVGRVVLIGLIPSPTSQPQVGVRPIIWLHGRHTVSTLGRILHDAVGSPSHDESQVHISFREREVLSTYVLGATVEATAATHHIAVSTVKTHYRRVAERYSDAGRPVTNKAQLLVEMVADGWVNPGRSDVA